LETPGKKKKKKRKVQFELETKKAGEQKRGKLKLGFIRGNGEGEKDTWGESYGGKS